MPPDDPGTGTEAGSPAAWPRGARASDADRDRFAAQLHEHFAEGRLSLEELQRRLDLVFAAQTLVDLYELTGDLPHPGPDLPRAFASRHRPVSRRRRWWPFG